MLTPDQNAALHTYLVSLADDQFWLGQRASEWCGHAPLLEEDIAFANLALDEIGHASWLYSLAAKPVEQDPETYPDQLVFRRPAAEFLNLPMVELPNGDWAFSMLRQFLFDLAESLWLAELMHCEYLPLAELCAKIRQEELYHVRHTRAWVRRLGLGTEESQARMQTALDALWPYALQLLDPAPGETELAAAGLLPEGAAWRMKWEQQARADLTASGLVIPSLPPPAFTRRLHTPQFNGLVAEMQSVARLDPQATW